MTFWHLKKENSSFSSLSQMLGHNKTNQRLSVPPENHVCGKGSKARERRRKRKHNSRLNDMKMNHTF